MTLFLNEIILINESNFEPHKIPVEIGKSYYIYIYIYICHVPNQFLNFDASILSLIAIIESFVIFILNVTSLSIRI